MHISNEDSEMVGLKDSIIFFKVSCNKLIDVSAIVVGKFLYKVYTFSFNIIRLHIYPSGFLRISHKHSRKKNPTVIIIHHEYKIPNANEKAAGNKNIRSFPRNVELLRSVRVYGKWKIKQNDGISRGIAAIFEGRRRISIYQSSVIFFSGKLGTISGWIRNSY